MSNAVARGERRRGLARGVAAVVTLHSLAFAAEPAARVCVVGDPRDPVVARLERELALVDVVVAMATTPRQRCGADDTNDAVVLVERGRASIRFASAYGGDEMDVVVGRGSRPELVALATVELLRGRLLEIPSTGDADEVRTRTKAREAPPSPEPPAVGPERSGAQEGSARVPHGSVVLGPELSWSAAEAPFAPGLLLGMDMRLGKVPYLAVRGHLPLGAGRVEVTGGEVVRRVQGLELMAGLRSRVPGAPLELAGGAGCGLVRVELASRAISPAFSGEDVTRWAAVPKLELAPAWRPHGLLGVRAVASIGVAVPEVAHDFVFEGPAVATATRAGRVNLGSPFGFVGLGGELRW